MRIGKGKSERKAYPHGVYPDRNRIRSGANGASGPVHTYPDNHYAILSEESFIG